VVEYWMVRINASITTGINQHSFATDFARDTAAKSKTVNSAKTLLLISTTQSWWQSRINVSCSSRPIEGNRKWVQAQNHLIYGRIHCL